MNKITMKDWENGKKYGTEIKINNKTISNKHWDLEVVIQDILRHFGIESDVTMED